MALFVAAVGCSAPVGGPVPDALPITVVGAQPPAEDEPADTAASKEQSIPTPLVQTGAIVTSWVTDVDGAVYSTGTYVGSIQIDQFRLVSRGRQDVFLVKWAADGSLAWVLSAGSADNESIPKIGAVDGGRVKLLGLTEGRIDCGSGPLPIWTTGTFFLCVFATDTGATLASGTFPTGAP